MTNKKLEKNLKYVLMATIENDDLDLHILVDIFFEINNLKFRDYREKDIIENYLKAIAKNIGSNKFKTLKLVKEMLEDWDISKRLDFLLNVGKMLIEFLYGHSPYYYRALDSNALLVDKIRTDDKHYPYIALNLESFVESFLKPISNTYGHRKSFIDVGCGIGDKTFLAWLSGLFDECYGVEYSKLTYEIAYKHLSSLGLYDNILYGNAFKYNFEPYDTIYLYCPISNDENMHRLYVHIFGQIKSGAIMKEMLFGSGLLNFLSSNGVSSTTTRSRHHGIVQKVYSEKLKKCICKYVKDKE